MANGSRALLHRTKGPQFKSWCHQIFFNKLDGNPRQIDAHNLNWITTRGRCLWQKVADVKSGTQGKKVSVKISGKQRNKHNKNKNKMITG